MRRFTRKFAILPILVAAAAFVLCGAWRRCERVRYVTGLARSAEAPALSGDRDEADRQLIIPGESESSFEWIAQTDAMLSSRRTRLRQVDYENAPFGRDVRGTSPYRWYLAALAWINRAWDHRSMTGGVEAAACWADPLVHLVFLAGGTLLVAAAFGLGPAIIFCVGSAVLFPFAAEFIPAAPDVRGAAMALAMTSIILLLAGSRTEPPPRSDRSGQRNRRRANLWFGAAGVVGGIGLWASAGIGVPMLAGVVIGGILGAWLMRSASVGPASEAVAAPPWRVWAAFAGATVLLASLAEYAPNHLASWRLDVVHPLYGVAWIVAGELLARVNTCCDRRLPRRVRDHVILWVAAAALASIPVALWKMGNAAFLVRNADSVRLARLPEEGVARTFFEWAAHAVYSCAFWVTISPILVVIPAWVVATRRSFRLEDRVRLALALGPLVVAFCFALQRLRWWAVVDATAIVAAVAAASAIAATGSRLLRIALVAGALAIGGVGAAWSWPTPSAGAANPITASDAEQIIERDLAKWLAFRSGRPGAIVYAPPQETVALCYYGHLRGIGTLSPENHAGMGASLMLAGASSMEAVQALLEARRVRYIVIPSWDPFFENFARQYLARSLAGRPSLLAYELRRLNLPPWLKPLAYEKPLIGGFESQWVLVFEVVNDQSPVAATSRLAEYLVETGNVRQATTVGRALHRYPGNVGALAALASVQDAAGDAEAYRQTVSTLVTLMRAGGDRNVPWDRRVGIAVALGRAHHAAMAREQVTRIIEGADDPRLRSLSTTGLYDLLVLAKAFGLRFPDPRLEALAMQLLPADVRKQL